MLRKCVSVIMSLVIVLSITTIPSHASLNDFDGSGIQVVQFKDGYFYTETNEEYHITMAAEAEQDIEFNLVYTGDPDKIYQQFVPNHYVKKELFASTEFWSSAKEVALNNIDNSETIYLNREMYKTHGTTTLSSRAVSKIRDELSDIYGSEYRDKVIASSNEYLPHYARVREDLDLHVELISTLTCLEKMTIAAWIASFFFPASWAATIAKLLTLGSIYDFITPGTSVDHYRATAFFNRRGCINGLAYISATRSDVYNAFEEGGDVEVATPCEKIYSPSKYYYEDHRNLMREAYEYYIRIN